MILIKYRDAKFKTHLFVDSITLVGTKLWSAKHIDEFQCRSWWTLDRIKET